MEVYIDPDVREEEYSQAEDVVAAAGMGMVQREGYCLLFLRFPLSLVGRWCRWCHSCVFGAAPGGEGWR